MNNAIYHFKEPANEPMLLYLKGSKERELLLNNLNKVSSESSRNTINYRWQRNIYWNKR